MISTIAPVPASARPPATPTMPPSLSGVVSTRSGLAVDSPRVILNAPPYGSSDVLAEQRTTPGRRRATAVQRLVEVLRDPSCAAPTADGGRAATSADDRAHAFARCRVEPRSNCSRVRAGVARRTSRARARARPPGAAGVVALAVRAEPVRGELHHQRARRVADPRRRSGASAARIASMSSESTRRWSMPNAAARPAMVPGQLAAGRRGLGDAVVLDHARAAAAATARPCSAPRTPPPRPRCRRRCRRRRRAPGLGALEVQRDPGRDRQALALHPGGEVAVAPDVLAAADPVADGALPAHDLGEQPVADRRYRAR